MVSSPVAPPLVELGRLAGWAPLPISVRDARRLRRRARSRELAADLACGCPPPAGGDVVGQPSSGSTSSTARCGRSTR